MTTLWFDCETFSECDLKSHGTHRYAEHPSTEIMIAQWAIDDGEPVVLDCTAPGIERASHSEREYPHKLGRLLLDPSVEIVAHNSHFDRTILRHCWGIDVPIERWRDTMVLAYAHGLPGGLDKLSTVLNLSADEAKDQRGKDLIRLFCKPLPANRKLRRATPWTHPQEWAEFLTYSRSDIISMRATHRKLPKWNYREGSPILAQWHLDQKINDRGFAVDLELAHAAIAATDAKKAELRQDIIDATDGEVDSATQRDQLLAHILMSYGVALPDMRADTLRRRMEDPELPEGLRLLLAIRLEATKTSTAKYQAVVDATSDDGRLRNTLQFGGAQRTLRWAGRIFQPQNTPRPTMPKHAIAQAIDALKLGVAGSLYDDVMTVCSNTVRGIIVAPPGRKLVVSDLANIEGRVLAWLAGEEWKVQAFRDYDTLLVNADGTPLVDAKGKQRRKGPDLYVAAYARSFNTGFDISDEQRQIGKVQELALGYQGGVAAFLTFAAVYNMSLDDLAGAVWQTASAEALKGAQGWWAWAQKKRRTLGLSQAVYVACQVLVSSWRAAHPQVVAFWAAAEAAVRNAIEYPGVPFDAGPRITVRVDGAWLRVALPSGRYVCYLNPAVADDGQITFLGVDQYTRQWKRIKTYGGKLVENWTQATARDTLAWNLQDVEDAGFEVLLTVHDEVPAEAPDRPEFSAARLSALLATNKPWNAGLPLAAAGFETYRYGKG
ncbi:MAG: hypothetical protein RLZZ524_2353 [Pseudomonadota bacterium]